MRGKASITVAFNSAWRITPAYAGKSGYGDEPIIGITDHPRVCGEKKSLTKAPSTIMGSPPRMRGKAQSVQIFAACQRITPAYAGKSVSFPSFTSDKKDHPRVCGEKFDGVLCRLGYGRITPAYAGKRHLRRFYKRRLTDHPRVCGEKATV